MKSRKRCAVAGSKALPVSANAANASASSTSDHM
jgi:hypothetical protein